MENTTKEQLLKALSRSASLEEIQAIVGDDPAILKRTSWGNATPLCHALQDPSVDKKIVDYLIQAWPQSLRMADHQADLPIHIACRSGVSVEIVRGLAKRYPKSLKLSSLLGTPLHCACTSTHGSLDVVKVLADQYPKAVRVKASNYFTDSLPIHDAIRSGCDEKVIFLAKAFPRCIEGKLGTFALRSACQKGRSLSVVRCLMEGQHKPKSLSVLRRLMELDPQKSVRVEKHSRVPLQFACASKNPSLEVVEYLLEIFPDQDQDYQLHSCCLRATPEVVQCWTKRFPQSVRVKDHRGELLLHKAVKHEPHSEKRAPEKHEQIVALVRAYPASVLVKSKDGKTPVDFLNEWRTDKYPDRPWLKRQQLETLACLKEQQRQLLHGLLKKGTDKHFVPEEVLDHVLQFTI